jgi:hypothetical protein
MNKAEILKMHGTEVWYVKLVRPNAAIISQPRKADLKICNILEVENLVNIPNYIFIDMHHAGGVHRIAYITSVENIDIYSLIYDGYYISSSKEELIEDVVDVLTGRIYGKYTSDDIKWDIELLRHFSKEEYNAVIEKSPELFI